MSDLGILTPQCNACVMILRKLGVIFVETLCTVPNGSDLRHVPGKYIYLIRYEGQLGRSTRTSVGKAEQGADPFRSRGMAAKQTHCTILPCRCYRQDRKTSVVTFQLVERSDQRLPVSSQFKRGGIGIQLAGAGQCQTKQLRDRGSRAQQRRQRSA